MKIVDKVKQYGIKKSIIAIFNRLLKTNINRFHYFKYEIDYQAVLRQVEKIDFSIKELTIDDFLLGDAKIFCGKKLQSIQDRCNDTSYRAYGIIKDGKLIYSTWISLEKLGLPIKKKYFLMPDEGLLEDSYCHPSARGLGLHSQMNYYRLAKLYEIGKTKCVAIVLHGNTPAYKVQLKSGFEDIGSFYAGTILGMPVSTLNKKKYDCR